MHTLRFVERLGRDEILKKRQETSPVKFLGCLEEQISENTSFDYYIVTPDTFAGLGKKAGSAILLFHGLNERNWDKYIPWAEYLSNELNRPVILFPLSMHINRSPLEWSNPRAMQKLINDEFGDGPRSSNLSFLNYALSSRLKSDPFRFYLSGRESIYNVYQLMNEIRSGRHELISKGAKIDIFAYSIGGLLSQVLLTSDVQGYFAESKLFMFCAGSLFNEMNGSSKMIMDGDTFDTLTSYFTTRFIYPQHEKRIIGDNLEQAFISHIASHLGKERREAFYRNNLHRVGIISLKQDKVIPTSGILSAIGTGAAVCLEEMDFPFHYSHEIPFPVTKENAAERKYCFEKVFGRAAEFLR